MEYIKRTPKEIREEIRDTKELTEWRLAELGKEASACEEAQGGCEECPARLGCVLKSWINDLIREENQELCDLEAELKNV